MRSVRLAYVSGIHEAGLDLVDAYAELVIENLDAGDARRASTVSGEAGDRLPLHEGEKAGRGDWDDD